MKEIKFIVAKDKHILGIVKLLKKVGIGVDINKDAMKKIRKACGDLCIVALDDDKVIGMIASVFNGVSVWLSYFAVLPEYRDLGVGSKLEQITELKSAELGAVRIITDSWIEAAPFYRKRGYRLPECVFMIKDLTSGISPSQTSR
ncbi:MAG: GNAT family N-acetyltransferase [bacterium]